MPYVSMHPLVTATVKRTTLTTVGVAKQRRVTTQVGSVTGGYEDRLRGLRVKFTNEGYSVPDQARMYCDRAQETDDFKVLRGDVFELTDPSTGEALVLKVINRRGPWDETDEEDRFEIDLVSEQPVVS